MYFFQPSASSSPALLTFIPSLDPLSGRLFIAKPLLNTIVHPLPVC